MAEEEKKEDKSEEAPKEEAKASDAPAQEGEAPAAEAPESSGGGGEKKKKKISKMTLDEIESKIQDVRKQMGIGQSRYLNDLLCRQKTLSSK